MGKKKRSRPREGKVSLNQERLREKRRNSHKGVPKHNKGKQETSAPPSWPSGLEQNKAGEERD